MVKPLDFLDDTSCEFPALAIPWSLEGCPLISPWGHCSVRTQDRKSCRKYWIILDALRHCAWYAFRIAPWWKSCVIWWRSSLVPISRGTVRCLSLGSRDHGLSSDIGHSKEESAWSFQVISLPFAWIESYQEYCLCKALIGLWILEIWSQLSKSPFSACPFGWVEHSVLYCCEVNTCGLMSGAL